MSDTLSVSKQTRVRCSDEQFLEAVYSSNTYAEVAEKTGQKLTTTMARYARTKAALAAKGENLPPMQRAKPSKKVDQGSHLLEIVQRLKASHTH